jgi:CPA1 family monovalent cation:H+ antiporter
MVDPVRLRSRPFLMDLDEHDLAVVARRLEEVRASPGELLIEQGSMPFDLFLIESGTVDVVRDGEEVASLGPGDVVGEIGILAQQRRMASVRARTDLVALALPVDGLIEITQEMPELGDQLRALMATRGAPGTTTG